MKMAFKITNSSDPSPLEVSSLARSLSLTTLSSRRVRVGSTSRSSNSGSAWKEANDCCETRNKANSTSHSFKPAWQFVDCKVELVSAVKGPGQGVQYTYWYEEQRSHVAVQPRPRSCVRHLLVTTYWDNEIRQRSDISVRAAVRPRVFLCTAVYADIKSWLWKHAGSSAFVWWTLSELLVTTGSWWTLQASGSAAEGKCAHQTSIKWSMLVTS